MAAIEDSGVRGVVTGLCIHTNHNKDITTENKPTVQVSFQGFVGDSHSGLTRNACVRVKQQYKKGTVIRNTRQISIVSDEELVAIAAALDIPAVKPEWLGANLSLSGIPDFTKVPPASRLLFSSGASLVIDVENEPCKYPAEVIDQHHPGAGRLFVKNAIGMRGVSAWVECEGKISLNDSVELHIPAQRSWSANSSGK